MINRPINGLVDDSTQIFQYLNQETNPAVIAQTLNHLRVSGYANKLNDHNPIHIVLKALLADDINQINANKLRQAAGDVGQIIEAIAKFLLLLLEYLKAHCNKTPQAIPEFYNLLKQMNGNPFVNLAHAHIHDANLQGINLQYANLEDAHIRGTDMTGAFFGNANLRDVDFEGTCLKNCNFVGADVRWADFSKAFMDDQVLSNLKAYLQTRLPANVYLAAIPSVEAVNATIYEIKDELEQERTNEVGRLAKLVNKLEQHIYHTTVANNVVKIGNGIPNANLGYHMMQVAFQNPYFSGHTTSRYAAKGNSWLKKVHNLFTTHRSDVPFVSSMTQNGIRKEWKAFENQEIQQRTPFSPSRRS